MDVQSIAMHEVGHWLVLNDLYGPGDTTKVMYGFGDYESVARTLERRRRGRHQVDLPRSTRRRRRSGAKNATAKKNQTVKIYFRVYDDISAQVASQVQIVTKNGTVKKTWTWDYGENYDGWWWVKYKAALAKGKYAIIVTGTDLAGNSAKAVRDADGEVSLA